VRRLSASDTEATATPPHAASPAEGGSSARLGSAWRQWYLVIVLTAIYTLGFIDRSALNLLVNPIQHDLGVSEVQMSLLIGFSFVTLYSLLSIPGGYLADIFNRRLMIAVAIFFWSCAATLCGFASSYWQLYAGRVGLGVGEAALPPAAYSLLRDGVAPDRRGRAFSVYQVGLTLGTGLGALIGGFLYDIGERRALHGWPVVGDLKPWQLAIVVPGLSGLLLAGLALTLREPPRTTSAAAGPARASFGEMFRYVRRSWRVYAPIFGGVTCISFAGGGWNAWMAAAMGRAWDLSPASVGKTLGLIGLLVFPVSAFIIGWLIDLQRRKQRPAGPFWVSIVGCALNLVPAMLVFQAPTTTLMWVAYAFSVFVNGGVQISCGIMLANVTPGRLMGKVTAFYYLVANLVGLGLGVTAYAAVAQYGFSGRYALAHAMMLCYALTIGLTILILLLGTREVSRWYARQEVEPA